METTFREAINTLVTVPVEKIIFRTDKWGDVATVYFHGKAQPVFFEAENLADADEIKAFLHYVKNGSELMLNEARQMFGDKYAQYIKIRGDKCQLNESN